MKKYFKNLITILILTIITICLINFIRLEVRKNPNIISDNTDNEAIPVISDNKDRLENQTKEISIVAAGDILFHMPQVRAAEVNGTYDFKPMFSEVKPYIESSDIAIVNFETTVYPKVKLSGYPCFNSPEETLEALKDTGFDVLINNHNHSLDNGLEGLKSTNSYIKKYGFELLGVGEPDEDKFVILEKNGIKVAMLSYTYGTNFGVQHKDRINYIDEDKIKQDIENVKEKSDFIIVFLHIGTEYVRTVEDFQQELVNNVASFGADTILCSHPHVAKKTELLDVEDRKVLVNYSMGNFISNQNDKYTDIGSIQHIKIEKNDGMTRIKSTETIPVYRLRYKSNGKTIYRVVPSKDMDKFSNIVGDSTMSYINETSTELSFKYDAPKLNTINDVQ